MKIDLHIHTEYSHDGSIKLEDIERMFMGREGIIDAVAITDHNSIEGALKLKNEFRDNIIVGEEIDTGEGQVIGYWLTEPIQTGLGLRKTLETIKRQGGITCVPHPFDRLRKKRIDILKLQYIADGIDMLEVFNSRNLTEDSNLYAREFALKNKLLCTAGSDAHFKREIGNAYIECQGLKSVDGPKQVCAAIKEGLIKGKKSNICYHIKTKLIKLGIIHKTDSTVLMR